MSILSRLFVCFPLATGKRQSLATLCLLIIMLSVSLQSFADDDRENIFSYYGDSILSDERLSQLRGGFVTSDGVEIHVGIEKIALMNGELQSWLAMDFSKIPQSSIDVSKLNNVASVVQSGAGNQMSQGLRELVDSGVLSVIQNTLDDQKIQTLTELNINVSNVNNFHLPDLGRMLDFQVTQSLGAVR